MSKYYRYVYHPQDDDETDLPKAEYLKFISGWGVVTLISDKFNIAGTAKSPVIFILCLFVCVNSVWYIKHCVIYDCHM